MSRPMTNLNQPLRKRSAAILGIGLSAIGSVLVYFTAIQLDDFTKVFMNLLGAGLLAIGFMISTVAKAMREPDGDEANESQTKT